MVPFQDVQAAIRDHCNEENRVVLYRRMMYRIAAEIADRQGSLALVTGESLGQVASQTLEKSRCGFLCYFGKCISTLNRDE